MIFSASKPCFPQLGAGRSCDFYLQNQPRNRDFAPLFSPAHLFDAPLPTLLEKKPSPSSETPSQEVLEGSSGNRGFLTTVNYKMSTQKVVEPGFNAQTIIKSFFST